MPFLVAAGRRWPALSLFFACGLAALAAGAQASPQPPSGVLVETVEPGSLGERAGLRPGDVITGWSRAASGWANPLPASGPIATPFDFEEAVLEQAPRGALTLSGLRDGVAKSWTLPAGASASRIGVRVRPRLPPAAAWMLGRRAEELARARDFVAADRAWDEAVAAQVLAGEPIAAALTLGRRAESLWLQVRPEEARRRSAEAVALVAQLADRPLLQAEVLFGKAETLRQTGDAEAAAAGYRAALALRRSAAPGSLAEAEAFYGLGRALSLAGRDAEAEPALREAARLQRQLDPDSLAYARTLDALGVLARARGSWVQAVDLLQESLRLSLSRAGPGYDAGRAYLHLSQVALAVDDLPEAQELLLEARRCLDGLPEDFLVRQNLAHIYNRLATVSRSLGESDTGHWYADRALKIQAELAPDSLEMALTLDSRSSAAAVEGDSARAQEYARQAVALKEGLRPESVSLAYSLTLLGLAKAQRGVDLDGAREDLQRAGQLYERLGVAGASRAELLQGLAVVARKQRRWTEAVELATESVEWIDRSSTSVLWTAMALASLALTERGAGLPESARTHFCRAADILDRYGDQLPGGPNVRSQFTFHYGKVYFECMASLVAASEPGAAFQLLERGRARALLGLLANRDVLSAELPSDLAAERSRLRSAYASILSRRAGGEAADGTAQRLSVRERLAEIQAEEAALAERVRRASPRFAALHDPQPLRLEEARAALDPGTVLLAYAVDPDDAYLFVVEAAGEPGPGLQVYRLAVGLEALRGQVEALRRLLASPRSDGAALRSQARELYDLLVRPAEGVAGRSRRLLIAPDGPLHSLPFAVLRRPNGQALIEWRPLHNVISATVYAEIKRKRRPEGARPSLPGTHVEVAAFGDPAYPPLSGARPEEAADLRLRSALRRGLTLAPLPASRREVEALGRLFPQARLFLGREASEERAKSLGGEVRIVHFAGHALLDEELPLHSSLALAIPENRLPGREDGLLEAWEIIEQLRLDADLVTLSACNTALGREVGGEGLVGLTRAFQFAGARTVLASLWAIGDRSTSRFLPRFYEHLRSGLTKDEALRRTQIEWLRNPRTAHPFHWAAFELVGDYR